MVNLKFKLLDKGRIVQEQLVRTLQRHEDAIANNTTGDSAIAEVIGDSDSGLVKDVADAQSSITALETAIGDADTEGSILARIKALEDAQ